MSAHPDNAPYQPVEAVPEMSAETAETINMALAGLLGDSGDDDAPPPLVDLDATAALFAVNYPVSRSAAPPVSSGPAIRSAAPPVSSGPAIRSVAPPVSSRPANIQADPGIDFQHVKKKCAVDHPVVTPWRYAQAPYRNPTAGYDHEDEESDLEKMTVQLEEVQGEMSELREEMADFKAEVQSSLGEILSELTGVRVMLNSFVEAQGE
jgi:hypothetical protein